MKIKNIFIWIIGIIIMINFVSAYTLKEIGAFNVAADSVNTVSNGHSDATKFQAPSSDIMTGFAYKFNTCVGSYTFRLHANDAGGNKPGTVLKSIGTGISSCSGNYVNYTSGNEYQLTNQTYYWVSIEKESGGDSQTVGETTGGTGWNYATDGGTQTWAAGPFAYGVETRIYGYVPIISSLLVNWNGYTPTNNSVINNGAETQIFYFNISSVPTGTVTNCSFYWNGSNIETKNNLANGTKYNFTYTATSPLQANISSYISCIANNSLSANTSTKNLQYNLTQGITTNLTSYLGYNISFSPIYVNVSTISFGGVSTTCTVKSNNSNAVCTNTTGTQTSFNIACSVPYPTVTDISFYGNCNTSTLNYNSTAYTLQFNYTAGIFSNVSTYTTARKNFTIGLSYNGISGSTTCGVYDNSSKVSCSDNIAVLNASISTCIISNNITRDYTTLTPYCSNTTHSFNGSAATVYVANAGQINFSAKYLNGSSISNFNVSYGLGSFQASGSTLYAVNYFGTDEYSYYEPYTVGFPVNITLENDTQAYEFPIYETNVMNFTFKEEGTNTIMDFTTVTFELISDLFAANYSTSTGYSYLSLLTPTDYIIRYSAENYTQRFYYFTLANRTVNQLTLYLINSSLPTSVTATVIDQVGNNLEGAVIKVLKYDIDTNSYNTVEIVNTNFEGQAILNIELNTEFYKFIIEYPYGTVRQETTPTYIYSDTLNFQILLDTAVGTGFENLQGVNYNLSFNTASDNFRFTYSDTQNIAYMGCLKVYTITGLATTLYNSSCSVSSSGTILIYVLNTSSTTYLAKSYIYFDANTETYLTSLTHSYPEEIITSQFGLLIVAILMIIFACISIWSPVFAAILTPFPLSFAAYIGIIDISFTVLLSVHIISLIIAFVLAQRN